MAEGLFFEDFRIGDVEEFGRYDVTRDEVLEFAARFDPQDMHLSDAAAEANPVFGRLSASGVHTFAMSSRMIAEHSRNRHIHILAGLGLDEMRLRRPVYPGDSIRIRTTIKDVRRSVSRPNCGIVVTEVQALNQDGETVLVYRSSLLISTR